VGEAGFIKRLSGYVAGEDLALRKTFSSFPGNPERFGHPTTSSVVLVFGSETS
jgi:ornithine cyclodeaminase/alanine dehydrogenase-like protein (mu-crystallin family)